MKAAVWTDYNKVELQEVPVPEISSTEALVKVHSAGVCATDLEVITGRFSYGRPPHILGHEIAGEIVAVGADVEERRIGERVVIETSIGCGTCRECKNGDRHLCSQMEEIGTAPHQGGYAQYVKAPADNLVLIPDNVSYDEAGIVESVVCPVGGLMRLGVRFGETVLVYGVGPAGIAFIQGAKAMGAGKVIAVARNDERLQRAKKFGADLLINSKKEDVREKVMEFTGGKGAGLVCEAAGSGATTRSAFECVKRAGRIMLYGIPNKDQANEFSSLDIIMNQLEVYGVLGNPHVWEPLLTLVSSGRINLKDMVYTALPLSEINKAFELMEDPVKKPIKIVVHPWEE
ncbi:zinc-dependent alcohol dehydrogenase [Massiliimalia massiliensis]|uniref:zinc-dependent alcohol dehydrogenase n=1 Tax=Massiliimalia massiliensis TaxID=1852384 RepID=UPI0009853B64|nr:alcohol dehydrogenase catalytic domain-containing protein [Massiliimalia massiliensis]